MPTEYTNTPSRVIWNSKGEPTGVDIPHVPESTKLFFQIEGQLVPYKSDYPGLLIGTTNNFTGTDKASQMIESFGALLGSVFRRDRELFPPHPIIIEDKKYEVFLTGQCLNTDCEEYEA